MFHIILYQPEIPPNTGNAIRLCANVGAHLHLVQPLGFDLSAAQLRRAGMDYAELADVRIHENLGDCLASLHDAQSNSLRLFALSTRGTVRHDQPHYQHGDAFLFGPESRGLPIEVLQNIAEDRRIRLPMQPDCRSINLSNSVAIVAYETWRQLGFAGGV